MPLGNAFGAITSVNSALGALGRIEEIIALPGEDAHDSQAASLAQLRADAPAIAFDRVSFSYPALPGESESAPVLREVSFEVPRGKRTALVGPSGAGKSTSLALIERFYDPTSGAIRLGGADIAELPRDELRAQLGYVEQDAPALAGSLRDNLTLGAPSADDDACRRVLEAVNLGEVLARSPLGLEAPVGEEGVMLSGGERQRLAIARALLAAPPILLLDESTSSLDGRNEQLMREAIDAVAENRTMIVIAHRLSTVVDSDQIVVLDHGRVVGVGTHSELVATVPLYRELAKHQLLV
jgi:ATP-binding cassette subfamily B protein